MFYRRFIQAICTLVFASSLTAEELDSIQAEKEQKTDEQTIVILGKVPRPINDVFGAASVISREMIDSELMHDIADLAKYQAGISIENAGTRFGLSGFTIRGIGGNRVATEVDGIPVADQFGIGSYSNSGRNFVDIDLVQQVEILRGPASSIYGSNAIGGVVSFVTKKPVDLLSKTDKDYYVGLKGGYYGVDNSNLFSVNTAFAHGDSSALISLTSSNGHEFDNHASGDTIIDRQDNSSQSILAKYIFDFSENQQLSFSLDYFTRESETDVKSLLGEGRFRSTTGLFGDDESKRQKFALAYDFTSDNAWLEGGVVRLYKQKTETTQLTDETRFSRGTNFFYDRDFFYEQDIEGLRLNFYTNVSSGHLHHRIGYGVEWSERKITELRNALQTNLDDNTSTNVILSEQFPLRDFPISKVKEQGFYINDEIEIEGTGFSIIPALRFDQYRLNPMPDTIYLEDNQATSVVSIKESNLSPKLGFQYETESDSRWFLQYFEGFRAPPFEDANIGLDMPLFNIRAIPNPDLKSESSTGYELGYRYGNSQHTLDIVGFYTNYDDFIQTKVNLGFDPVAGRLLFQSQNIDSAKIYGSEVQYSFNSTGWLSKQDSVKVYANLFWSKGENEETQQPLNNIDPNHLLLGTNWQSPSKDWSAALHLSLYAAKDDIDELDDPADVLFKTSGYGVLDLIANYQINDKAVISAAIYNLTDKQYWRWSDVNGLLVGDPVIDTLSSSGISGSLQLRIHW